MDRRLVIKNAGIAGVLAAGIAPAVQAQAPAANEHPFFRLFIS